MTLEDRMILVDDLMALMRLEGIIDLHIIQDILIPTVGPLRPRHLLLPTTAELSGILATTIRMMRTSK